LLLTLAGVLSGLGTEVAGPVEAVPQNLPRFYLDWSGWFWPLSSPGFGWLLSLLF
jgi:hypothetical protein